MKLVVSAVKVTVGLFIVYLVNIVALRKTYMLEEDKVSDIYRMKIHTVIYHYESCIDSNRLMDMDIHNQIKIISKKYHRVETTTTNILLKLSSVLPSEYKCNSIVKANTPISLKYLFFCLFLFRSLICSHDDSHDIFRIIRGTIRKSYPVNAFFSGMKE